MDGKTDKQPEQFSPCEGFSPCPFFIEVVKGVFVYVNPSVFASVSAKVTLSIRSTTSLILSFKKTTKTTQNSSFIVTHTAYHCAVLHLT